MSSVRRPPGPGLSLTPGAQHTPPPTPSRMTHGPRCQQALWSHGPSLSLTPR